MYVDLDDPEELDWLVVTLALALTLGADFDAAVVTDFCFPLVLVYGVEGIGKFLLSLANLLKAYFSSLRFLISSLSGTMEARVS